MKALIKIASASLFLVLLAACEGSDRFDVEMYKKVVYVLSKEDDRVFYEIHSLDEEISTGNVAVLIGGLTPIDEEATVELEMDTTSLDAYNEKYYGLDSSKYISALHPSHFEIPSFKVVVKTGGNNPRGLMPIKIRPEGLSPDSAYFIPLRIKSTSAYEINPKRSNVLYRIYLKNQFADQYKQTVYTMRGDRQDEGKFPYAIMANKRMFPLTKNKMRTTVEQATYENKLDVINKNSMVIEFNADSSLILTPYNKDYLDLEMIPKEEYNRYGKDIIGVKRFYLSYRYRNRNNPSDNWPSSWTTITEKMLRVEDIKE